MAASTPSGYRNLVLYSVYTRNFGPNGTFADVEGQLERIRSMGVDVVWFMPIHPIGKIQRKGSLGSPYSISDYRAVNPEYGTLEDFKRLIEKAHGLGLEVMIDVVYNHTAHDSNLVSEHPDWYHPGPDGRPVTTVPEWSDVIDLKYPNPALEDYLTGSLIYWVEQGVDGFRCDVASLVPLDFWKKARAAVEQIKPGIIWLAESVHASFVENRRLAGLSAISDSELYQAFDMEYDYDIWAAWQLAVSGQAPVERYLEMLRLQDAIYPANYVKVRCVENHDQARIQQIALTPALAWTAFEAFNKGAFLIYNGQESAETHTPSLFERDPVQWGDLSLQPFLTRLAQLKKHPAQMEGAFVITQAQAAVEAVWFAPGESLVGVFNLGGAGGSTLTTAPDGMYTDLLSGKPVLVQGGRVEIPETAVIFGASLPTLPRLFYSPLLDFYFPPA